MFFQCLDVVIHATLVGFGLGLGFAIIWGLVFFGCCLCNRIERAWSKRK